MSDLAGNGAARTGFRWRPWHFVVLGIAGVGIFFGGLTLLVSSLTAPVVAGGDAFMTALRDGQFERAHALATPRLQQELGSAAAFADRVGPFRPREWRWSHRALRNGVGALGGSAEFADGPGRVQIELHKVGGEWRVAAFRFQPER